MPPPLLDEGEDVTELFRQPSADEGEDVTAMFSVPSMNDGEDVTSKFASKPPVAPTSSVLANMGRSVLGGVAGGVADIVGGAAGVLAAPGRSSAEDIAEFEAKAAALSSKPSVFKDFTESQIAGMQTAPEGYRTPQEEVQLASYDSTLKTLRERQAKNAPIQQGLEDFQKLSSEASKEAQTFFGQDPARQDEFLSKLATGAGSLPPYIASSIAGGPVASMMIGALQTGQNEYNAAIEAGKPELADEAMVKGMGIGLTEGAGVGGGLGKAAKGFAAKALVTLKKAFEEGGQEWVQNTLSNLNASTFTGYESERPAFKGSGEAFAIGAILGGGVEGVGQSIRKDPVLSAVAPSTAAAVARTQPVTVTVPEVATPTLPSGSLGPPDPIVVEAEAAGAPQTAAALNQTMPPKPFAPRIEEPGTPTPYGRETDVYDITTGLQRKPLSPASESTPTSITPAPVAVETTVPKAAAPEQPPASEEYGGLKMPDLSVPKLDSNLESVGNLQILEAMFPYIKKGMLADQAAKAEAELMSLGAVRLVTWKDGSFKGVELPNGEILTLSTAKGTQWADPLFAIIRAEKGYLNQDVEYYDALRARGKTAAQATQKPAAPVAAEPIAPPPAPVAKAMTRSEINERIAVLLKAPAKAGGKPRVSFKTQAEEASFRRGFEAANKKPGEPLPEQLPGVPAKEQKIYDAFSQGWSQAQIAIRSLSQPTIAPAPAAQAPAASVAPKPEPVAAAQKMPWEMTRAEYNSARFNFGFQTKNLPETARLLREEGEQAKAELNNVFGQNARRERDAVLGPLRAAAETELDKMFGQGMGKRLTQSHEQQVSQALREGKPVPESVLADYPDLKPTPTAPAAPVPEPVAAPAPSRIQLRSGPATYSVVEQLAPQKGDQPGETYFRVKNEQTGEEQTVEAADMKPVKAKGAALKPAEAKAMKKKLRGSESGAIPASLFADIADFGARIYRDGMSFARWSADMVRHLGERVRSALKELWVGMLNPKGARNLRGEVIQKRDQGGAIGAAGGRAEPKPGAPVEGGRAGVEIKEGEFAETANDLFRFTTGPVSEVLRGLSERFPKIADALKAIPVERTSSPFFDGRRIGLGTTTDLNRTIMHEQTHAVLDIAIDEIPSFKTEIDAISNDVAAEIYAGGNRAVGAILSLARSNYKTFGAKKNLSFSAYFAANRRFIERAYNQGTVRFPAMEADWRNAYALSGPHEFLAALMSDENFRNILQSAEIKGPKKSAWKRVIEAIKRLFGKATPSGDTTLLNRAMETIESLMQNPDYNPRPYDRAYGRSEDAPKPGDPVEGGREGEYYTRVAERDKGTLSDNAWNVVRNRTTLPDSFKEDVDEAAKILLQTNDGDLRSALDRSKEMSASGLKDFFSGLTDRRKAALLFLIAQNAATQRETATDPKQIAALKDVEAEAIADFSDLMSQGGKLLNIAGQLYAAMPMSPDAQVMAAEKLLARMTGGKAAEVEAAQAKTTLKTALDEQLKGMDESLREIMRTKPKASWDEIRQRIADEVVAKMNLATEAERKAATDKIIADLKKRMEKVRKELLAKMSKPGKPGNKTALDKLWKLWELGALDDDALTKVFMEKAGVKEFTPAFRDKLKKMYEGAETAPEGMPRERILGNIAVELALANPKTFSFWWNLAMSISYGNILGAFTTIFVNNPLGSLVTSLNMTAHSALANKGARAETLKGAVKTWARSFGDGVAMMRDLWSTGENLQKVSQFDSALVNSPVELLAKMAEDPAFPKKFRGAAKAVSQYKWIMRAMMAADAVIRWPAREALRFTQMAAMAKDTRRPGQSLEDAVDELNYPGGRQAAVRESREQASQERKDGTLKTKLDERLRVIQLLQSKLSAEGTEAATESDELANYGSLLNDQPQDFIGVIASAILKVAFPSNTKTDIEKALGGGVQPFVRFVRTSANATRVALDYAVGYGAFRYMTRNWPVIGAESLAGGVNLIEGRAGDRLTQVRIQHAYLGMALYAGLAAIYAAIDDDDEDPYIDFIGSGPTTPDERRRLRDTKRMRFNSIKIGDTYIPTSVGPLQPLAGIFAPFQRMRDNKKWPKAKDEFDEKVPEMAGVAVARGIADAMMNQSFTRSLADLLTMINTGKTSFGETPTEFIGKNVAQFIPGNLRGLSQLDEIVSGKKERADGFFDTAANSIAFYAPNGRAVTILGDEVDAGKPVAQRVGEKVFQFTTMTDDKTALFVSRNGLSIPDRQRKADGKRQTYLEYSAYMRESGKMMRNWLETKNPETGKTGMEMLQSIPDEAPGKNGKPTNPRKKAMNELWVKFRRVALMKQ